MQADGKFFNGGGASKGIDTLSVRRIRPIFEGTLFGLYDFLIVPDFAGGATTLYDAAIEMRLHDAAKFRLGKFKPPVGLERLQQDPDLLFAERGLPSDLVSQRDVGGQLSGFLWSGALSYQLALTNGAADGAVGDSDSNNGKEVSARLFVLPFKNSDKPALQKLGIGIAASDANSSILLPSFKTALGQQTFFSYGKTVAAKGEHRRYSPQAYYYWGPLGLLGEYIETSQGVDLKHTSKRLANKAWQVAASVVLTGEDAGFSGVKNIARPFGPTGKDGWGALELALRYQQLFVDDRTFKFGFANPATSSRRANAYTLGLNWYLNKNVKVVADYEETMFIGGSGGGNRPAEHVIVIRWQLAF